MSIISPSYYNYYLSTSLINSMFLTNTSSNISLDPIVAASTQASIISNYNSQLSSNALSALTTLNSYANSLSNASSYLNTSSFDNAFKQAVATSSSPNITSQSQSGATFTSYNITASQLAQSQQNSGTALISSSTTGLTAGTYSFNIQSNGQNYYASYNVNSADTNQTVLNNMATAINNSGAGITATVNNDTVLGTSSLILNSNNTGTNSSFSITDITGNAVSYTGANNITTTAQNLNYNLNGISNTSQSNLIYLDNRKVSLNFSGLVSNATITVSPDTPAINNAINNFVNSYNNIITFANQNQQYISPEIYSTLTQNYQTQASNLTSIGITQNPDMTLSINQNVLNGALQNNLSQVKDAFSAFNGIAVTTGQIAQKVATSSLTTYINPNLYTQPNNYLSTYNYLGMLNSYNIISQLFPSGQLFNIGI